MPRKRNRPSPRSSFSPSTDDARVCIHGRPRPSQWRIQKTLKSHSRLKKSSHAIIGTSDESKKNKTSSESHPRSTGVTKASVEKKIKGIKDVYGSQYLRGYVSKQLPCNKDESIRSDPTIRDEPTMKKNGLMQKQRKKRTKSQEHISPSHRNNEEGIIQNQVIANCEIKSENCLSTSRENMKGSNRNRHTLCENTHEISSSTPKIPTPVRIKKEKKEMSNGLFKKYVPLRYSSAHSAARMRLISARDRAKRYQNRNRKRRSLEQIKNNQVLIARKKKLRSNKKDELWEGFPFNLSMPRVHTNHGENNLNSLHRGESSIKVEVKQEVLSPHTSTHNMSTADEEASRFDGKTQTTERNDKTEIENSSVHKNNPSLESINTIAPGVIVITPQSMKYPPQDGSRETICTESCEVNEEEEEEGRFNSLLELISKRERNLKCNEDTISRHDDDDNPKQKESFVESRASALQRQRELLERLVKEEKEHEHGESTEYYEEDDIKSPVVPGVQVIKIEPQPDPDLGGLGSEKRSHSRDVDINVISIVPNEGETIGRKSNQHLPESPHRNSEEVRDSQSRASGEQEINLRRSLRNSSRKLSYETRTESKACGAKSRKTSIDQAKIYFAGEAPGVKEENVDNSTPITFPLSGENKDRCDNSMGRCHILNSLLEIQKESRKCKMKKAKRTTPVDECSMTREGVSSTELGGELGVTVDTILANPPQENHKESSRGLTMPDKVVYKSSDAVNGKKSPYTSGSKSKNPRNPRSSEMRANGAREFSGQKKDSYLDIKKCELIQKTGHDTLESGSTLVCTSPLKTLRCSSVVTSNSAKNNNESERECHQNAECKESKQTSKDKSVNIKSRLEPKSVPARLLVGQTRNKNTFPKIRFQSKKSKRTPANALKNSRPRVSGEETAPSVGLSSLGDSSETFSPRFPGEKKGERTTNLSQSRLITESAPSKTKLKKSRNANVEKTPYGIIKKSTAKSAPLLKKAKECYKRDQDQRIKCISQFKNKRKEKEDSRSEKEKSKETRACEIATGNGEGQNLKDNVPEAQGCPQQPNPSCSESKQSDSSCCSGAPDDHIRPHTRTRSLEKDDSLLTGLHEVRVRKKKDTAPSQSELFKDVRLGIHACSLWSSENRRHFQLKHPNISSSDLDTFMRKSWDSLAKKEKMQYYKRAYDATNDKRNSRKEPKKSKSGPILPSKELTNDTFFEMEPWQQENVLKQKLCYFQRHLSQYHYDHFLQGYITSFRSSVANINYRKGRQKTSAPKDMTIDESHLDSVARRLLYIKMKDLQPFVDEVRQHKQFIRHERHQGKLESLVWKLIRGDPVYFNNDCPSQQLTELMDAVMNVENKSTNQGVMQRNMGDCRGHVHCSCSNQIEESQVRAIQRQLESNKTSATREFIIDNESIHVPDISTDNELNSGLLSSVGQLNNMPDLHEGLEDYLETLETLPVEADASINAHQVDVKGPLDEACEAIYRHVNGLESCCELESPSCILSSIMVDELMAEDNV